VKRQLWIFAGPNCARKSSLVAPYVRGRISIVLEAGRLAVAQREANLAAGHSFGVETTFTDHGEVNLMRRARAPGYDVTLVFIGLKSVKLSAARVRTRVRDGGHAVPLADVFRRFDRSMANLATGLTIADRSYVIDNSGRRLRLLLSRENGQVKHLAKTFPIWAAGAIPPELCHPIASGSAHLTL